MVHQTDEENDNVFHNGNKNDNEFIDTVNLLVKEEIVEITKRQNLAMAIE